MGGGEQYDVGAFGHMGCCFLRRVLAFREVGARITLTDLAEEVGTLDVDLVALVKVRLRRGLEGFHEQDAGTWDQNVDFAEFVYGLGHHTLNVLNATGITLDE